MYESGYMTDCRLCRNDENILQGHPLCKRIINLERELAIVKGYLEATTVSKNKIRQPKANKKRLNNSVKKNIDSHTIINLTRGTQPIAAPIDSLLKKEADVYKNAKKINSKYEDPKYERNGLLHFLISVGMFENCKVVNDIDNIIDDIYSDPSIKNDINFKEIEKGQMTVNYNKLFKITQITINRINIEDDKKRIKNDDILGFLISSATKCLSLEITSIVNLFIFDDFDYSIPLNPIIFDRFSFLFEGCKSIQNLSKNIINLCMDRQRKKYTKDSFMNYCYGMNLKNNIVELSYLIDIDIKQIEKDQNKFVKETETKITEGLKKINMKKIINDKMRHIIVNGRYSIPVLKLSIDNKLNYYKNMFLIDEIIKEMHHNSPINFRKYESDQLCVYFDLTTSKNMLIVKIKITKSNMHNL